MEHLHGTQGCCVAITHARAAWSTPCGQTLGAYNGDTVPERFASIVAPHLQSYNYFLTHGMANVVAGLEPFEVGWLAPDEAIGHTARTQVSIKRLETVHSLRAWFENIRYHKPKGTNGEKLWPSECRQSVRDTHTKNTPITP